MNLPYLRPKSIPHELEHLKHQAYHNSVFWPKRPHYETQNNLGTDRQNANCCNKYSNHQNTEAHNLQEYQNFITHRSYWIILPLLNTVNMFTDALNLLLNVQQSQLYEI